MCVARGWCHMFFCTLLIEGQSCGFFNFKINVLFENFNKSTLSRVNLYAVSKMCTVLGFEISQLTSSARPIVTCKIQYCIARVFSNASSLIGVMLFMRLTASSLNSTEKQPSFASADNRNNSLI